MVVPPQSAQFEQLRKMSDGSHGAHLPPKSATQSSLVATASDETDLNGPKSGNFNGINLQSLLDSSANKVSLLLSNMLST